MTEENVFPEQNLSMSSKLMRAIPLLACLMMAGAMTARAQVTVAQAVTDFENLTRGYNLVSFGNASFNNYGDTHGGLAVQGNLTLGGAGQIGQMQGSTNAPTLYVGGSLTLSSGQFTDLKSGYAYLPGTSGTWDGGSDRFTTGSGGVLYTGGSADAKATSNPQSTAANAASFGWNWSSVSQSLIAASNALAGATATGTISVSGQNLSFNAPNGQTSGVVIFNLDYNSFSGSIFDANGDHVFDQNNERVSNVQVNVPSNLTYVINVLNASGGTLFNGMNFNSGTGTDRLLWNILPATSGGSPIATTVSLGGGSNFYGSVLAPLVDLQNSGNVSPNGQIVAASYTHNNAELHETAFDTPVTFSAVPEPSTWGLIGLSACGLFYAWRERRRKLAVSFKR